MQRKKLKIRKEADKKAVIKCKFCGSREFRKAGFKLLSGGIKKQQYQCKKCGRVWHY